MGIWNIKVVWREFRTRERGPTPEDVKRKLIVDKNDDVMMRMLSITSAYGINGKNGTDERESREDCMKMDRIGRKWKSSPNRES